MDFNIIGAGKLGKNIALALVDAQIANLHSVVNFSLASAKLACASLGFGKPLEKIQQLPPTDMLWITTNDDTLSSIVSLLTKSTLLKPGCFVIHCSGVLNSTLLESLKVQGCLVASFHPLKAFRQHYLDTKAFAQVECVIEGDEKPCTWLKNSFTKLGAHVMPITPQAKASYHAAACIASNYLITLASCSEHLLVNAGFTLEQSRTLIVKLMQGNIDNLKTTPTIANALTGPLARGDTNTVALHLANLDSPLLQNLYKVMGLTTLPLTKLSEEKKQAITQLLNL